MMFKAKPARKIVRPVLSSSKRCGLSIMGPAQLGRFWKPGGGPAGRHRHRWRHQSLDGANCTGCGDVTRVTPLTPYREWIVQAARQRGWGGPRSPLPGTTSARARWSTLAYVEKVRPQFLSLRQPRRSRMVSARRCWHLSPVFAAISDLGSDPIEGRARPFFSE
jgi:hypothetical protein